MAILDIFTNNKKASNSTELCTSKKFKTQYDKSDFYNSTNNSPSMALPDLTFSIQELSQRFQINQLLLYNKQAQAMFDIKDDSKVTDEDFNRPSVNLPKNFDLVDSYNATKKFVEVKKKFREDMKNIEKRKAEQKLNERIEQEVAKRSQAKSETT